jgi:hypothetical protein
MCDSEAVILSLAYGVLAILPGLAAKRRHPGA